MKGASLIRHPVALCFAWVLLTAGGFAAGDDPTDPANEPSVRAVTRALPAVVNINTEHIVRTRVRDPLDALFDQFYGSAMRPPREISQKVESLGSGVIIDAQGYIVTNKHVLQRAADLKIRVTLSDGTQHEATFVASDDATDLALVKINNNNPFPYLPLTDISPTLLGQTVLALGNPLGYGSSVSRGIISATNRTVSIDEVEYSHLVQTDAAINPGNSGGALIDLQGKLVGINSVKMAYTPQGIPTQGIGFAIPASVVRERVQAMREKPSPVPGSNDSASWSLFGLRVQDLTPALSEALGLAIRQGVLVSDVDPGSPAAQAGVTPGLVITKVGRYEVQSVADLQKILAKVQPGDRADFEVGAMRRYRGRSMYQTETATLFAR